MKEDIMSKELWSNFFAAKKVDEAVQIFTRPLDAKTIRRLIHIARGSDPKITAIRKKVQATDNYDDVC
ncbi:MAG: hypothetical protein Q8P82_01705, partial [bacterium]|nr:hypothetical protein [bacterium]